MTRLYKVQFAHTRYGRNWCARTVAVNGWVPQAIARAKKIEGSGATQLRVEEVTLLGSED